MITQEWIDGLIKHADDLHLAFEQERKNESYSGSTKVMTQYRLLQGYIDLVR